MSFANKLNIPISLLKQKEFTWRGISFRVNVPSKNEAQALQANSKQVDEAKLEAEYQHLLATVEPSTPTRQEENDLVILITQDDESVKEVSLRTMARESLVRDNTIVAFMNLLHKADPSEAITIEDMDEDLSKNDQLELLEHISKVIAGKEDEDQKN